MTYEECKEWFDYKDGCLFWKKNNGGRIRIDKKVGWYSSLGYRTFNFNKKTYLEHRVIWLWHYGVFPKKELDHINHNTKDNRIENLREVNRGENQKNRSKNKNNKTGVSGIYILHQPFSYGNKSPYPRYHAYIQSGGVREHLYIGHDFFKACCRRKSAENRLGFHKNHGT